MESSIAKAIQLKYQPVALLWSDEKPADAMQFAEGKWGCVMWLIVHAAKGKTAVADKKPSAVSAAVLGWALVISTKISPVVKKDFVIFFPAVMPSVKVEWNLPKKSNHS